MKKLLFLLAAASFIIACSGPKGMVKIEPNGNEATPEDSVEYELNHKLFYYFQYVEQVLRIPILDHHPVGVVF